jgi:hypothetical protein
MQSIIYDACVDQCRIDTYRKGSMPVSAAKVAITVIIVLIVIIAIYFISQQQ